MPSNTAREQRRSALAEASVVAGEVAFGSRAALAKWIGTHRSQIDRAANGQELGGEAGWRLSGLAAVVTGLLAIYEPEAVSGWLHGNNPHLGDRRPLDVLAGGDIAAIMAAVQAARTGVYACALLARRRHSSAHLVALLSVGPRQRGGRAILGFVPGSGSDRRCVARVSAPAGTPAPTSRICFSPRAGSTTTVPVQHVYCRF